MAETKDDNYNSESINSFEYQMIVKDDIMSKIDQIKTCIIELEIEINDLEDNKVKLKNYTDETNRLVTALEEETINKFLKDIHEREEIIAKIILEKQKQINLFKEKLAKFYNLLLPITTYIRTRFPNINTEKNICTICLTNNISIALVPCGHTYCKDCIFASTNFIQHYSQTNIQFDNLYNNLIYNMENNKCPMCRKTIISYIDIYIS